VSRSTAGLLCISLAVPALLLGYTRSHPLYRPSIPCPTFHSDLYDQARSFMPTRAETIIDLELLLGLRLYLVYGGKFLGMAELSEIAADGMQRQGLLDEGLPVWGAFSQDEREFCRRVVSHLTTTCR